MTDPGPRSTLIVLDSGRKFRVTEAPDEVAAKLTAEPYPEFHVTTGSGVVRPNASRVVHIEPHPQERSS